MKKLTPALMKLLYGAIFSLLTCPYLLAQEISVTQEWVTRFNGTDSLEDVAVAIDADGCLFVAGTTFHLVEDVLTPYGVVIKYNIHGEQIWAVETTQPETFTNMIVGNNCDVHVSGIGHDSLDQVYLSISKYNALGQKLWQSTYPSASATDMHTDSFGNLYIAGDSQNETLFTVLKYNSSGTLLWAQTFNNDNDPGISAIGAKAIVVTDASIWATGYTDNNYLVTINYDTAGNVLWFQMFQKVIEDQITMPFKGMDRDENNNLYISVQTEGEIALIKYSPNGELLSITEHGTSSAPSAIKVDRQHQSIYITGRSAGSGILIKYIYSGEEQWENTLARSLPGALPMLAIDASGSIYTMQTTTTGPIHPNNADYITQRFACSGEKLWEIKFNGPSSRADFAAAIALDNSGNVYVTGRSFDFETNYDIATIKYNQEVLDMPGSTLFSAIDLGSVSDTSIHVTMNENGVMWFKFTANSTHQTVSATAQGIISLIIYSGGICSGLSEFASAFANEGDSLLEIDSENFSIGNEYFLEIQAGVNESLTVSLESPSSCLITADAGQDQTVYYGYFPSSCATLNSSVSNGTEPYNYVWSNGDTTASIIVCPSVTTQYTLTVEDANSCTTMDIVTVCVIDIRCDKKDNNSDKVEICHQSENNYHTICVSTSAVSAHLAHGDRLGACEAVSPCNSNNRIGQEKAEVAIDEIKLASYPNPFHYETTVRFNTVESGQVEVAVYTLMGAKVATLFKGAMNASEVHEEKFSAENISDGIYFVRLITEQGEIKTEKMLVSKKGN